MLFAKEGLRAARSTLVCNGKPVRVLSLMLHCWNEYMSQDKFGMYLLKKKKKSQKNALGG